MGINDFKIIYTEVTGDIEVHIDTQFNNIDATSVVLDENVTARLYGQIREKLVLNRGSKLFIHGSILGSVENLGGEIHVFEKEK